MKLYAWEPSGHGEFSFYVVADSEAEAIEKVEAEISRRKQLPTNDLDHVGNYDADGWGTDYYRLTVAEIGEVILGGPY